MLNNQIILNGITIQQLAEALVPLLQITTVKTQQLPEFISRKEASKILNIGLVTLLKHTKAGKLTSFGIGNRVMYKREDVLASLKVLNK